MCEYITREDLTRLNQELVNLNDLFKRRLLNDKVQSHALSMLKEELDHRRSEMSALCRESILLLDRAEKFSADENVQTFVDELLEILAHYGFIKIIHSRLFDPKQMKIVSREFSYCIPEGEVIRVEKEGYALNGLILRPQEVVTSRGLNDLKGNKQ